MSKYIKNTTQDTKTWIGQDVTSGSYYEIQQLEQFKWANDSVLLSDIGSGDAVVAKDNTGNADITDVSDAINFLKGDILDIDAQGRQVTRTAAAKSGWTYRAHSVEIESSKLGSLYSKDASGNDITEITLKFFDSNGAELTTQQDIDNSCVKTEMLFKPSYDYEIIGGTLHHQTNPTEDIRFWVIGGIIELGSNYTKEMISGINLKYIDHVETVKSDGRATKYMTKDIVGVPYQANQLKFIFRHSAGFKHKVMIMLEYFRA